MFFAEFRKKNVGLLNHWKCRQVQTHSYFTWSWECFRTLFLPFACEIKSGFPHLLRRALSTIISEDFGSLWAIFIILKFSVILIRSLYIFIKFEPSICSKLQPFEEQKLDRLMPHLLDLANSRLARAWNSSRLKR